MLSKDRKDAQISLQNKWELTETDLSLYGGLEIGTGSWTMNREQ